MNTLRREVGVVGAVLLGLGSIIGSGVFVSIGVATGAAGPAVLLAITLAAIVATCNGLSSASLAAVHPVSGGSYEYGYRWLSPSLGFTAGWMFLCAKTASAATAALGLSGYLLQAFGERSQAAHIGLAVAATIATTALVLAGMKRSNAVNAIVVSVTLLALATFVVAGAPAASEGWRDNFAPFFAPVKAGRSPLAGLLEASALMFVAYTGYGRVATLGEEIRDPRRNIPLAIAATLFVSMLLYVAVGFVGVAASGANSLADASEVGAAPLEIVARGFGSPWIARIVAFGAIAAMLGVLLNLILGLSRVVLAMARRGDLPSSLSRISGKVESPRAAVFVIGLTTAALTCVGSVKTTWSFSAFAVLIYYAITNLAALRLSASERLAPRFVPLLGLASCTFLAFWIEPAVWVAGLGLIAAGLLGRYIARRLRGS